MPFTIPLLRPQKSPDVCFASARFVGRRELDESESRQLCTERWRYSRLGVLRGLGFALLVTSPVFSCAVAYLLNEKFNLSTPVIVGVSLSLPVLAAGYLVLNVRRFETADWAPTLRRTAKFRFIRRFAARTTAESRLDLGACACWLSMALELALAADILRTAIAPGWNAIGQLAALAALRTALNYFLERDLAGSATASR